MPPLSPASPSPDSLILVPSSTPAGISTAKFYVGEKVKVFGISTSTDGSNVANPVPGNFSIEKVGTSKISL